MVALLGGNVGGVWNKLFTPSLFYYMYFLGFQSVVSLYCHHSKFDETRVRRNFPVV
jgi:hypothetical protein